MDGQHYQLPTACSRVTLNKLEVEALDTAHDLRHGE